MKNYTNAVKYSKTHSSYKSNIVNTAIKFKCKKYINNWLKEGRETYLNDYDSDLLLTDNEVKKIAGSLYIRDESKDKSWNYALNAYKSNFGEFYIHDKAIILSDLNLLYVQKEYTIDGGYPNYGEYFNYDSFSIWNIDANEWFRFLSRMQEDLESEGLDMDSGHYDEDLGTWVH